MYYCSSCNKEFRIIDEKQTISFNLIEALSLDIEKETDILSPSAKENVVIIESGQKWIECQECHYIIEKNYSQTKNWDEIQQYKKFFIKNFDSFFERLLKQQRQAFDIIESLGIYEEEKTENNSKSDDKKKKPKEELETYIKEAIRILRRENLVYPAIPVYNNQPNTILLVEFLIGNRKRSHNTRFDLDHTTLLLEKIIDFLPDIINYKEYNNIISTFNSKLNFDEKRELIKTHLSELEIFTHIVEKEKSPEDVNVLNRCSICGFRLSSNNLKGNKTICKQCKSKKKIKQ